jgi:hypothetical protein
LLLAFGFLLAVEATHLVARQPMLRLEGAEPRHEHVVRDRLQGDAVTVVNEENAADAPPPANVGGKRDLPARGDLHGGHANYHINRV